ncbi:HsdR family type I site-specific deoxyribonuclease [Anabaena cylindrica UHCC 0172]|uniref:HsdR family type I site-specific deoxyribonuclease n=1 Tax=Anabaena cylindrica TaxID=1165 RepID=UPI002B1F22D9|nr:HsdR family type I site-specific deoxyribonuclease [Anabaena cylindrica]MEA5551791.1 HsdR family type I site-specific deoxyribonuclease [Anabaena cylindrica UHCC 0172]
MAIKKSELYSSLWKSCDELRGGMDASQYKDYVLVLLFVKYVSDKYADVADALIEVPEGGGFRDIVALKGQKNIGDGINKIIANLAEANDLKGVIDVADFNDADKLGRGKEMQDRLSNLVAIFETPALNFSKNRADGDDILGDAYEYLMRNFATQSGKSKGQFYTPAEVSRVISQVISINLAKSSDDTIYDPTCGSGSLLLKAADEAAVKISIYGQEMDNATRALARMNHNQYFGVKAAQTYLQRREGGIIWHTQGSGKSLTMVWLTKWIREYNPNARVLIITDRDELDEQIENVFFGVNENIYRTKSGRDLINQLNKTTPWLLCSLIHKFGRKDTKKEKNQADYDNYIAELKSNLPQNFQAKGDIYVFVDECHRTQSGDLHKAMKKILPNALFIGFTGTLLLKKDKQNSNEIFGNYIHYYKFDEAVTDQVVLDLRYEARNVEQYITSQTKIDKWFAAKTRNLTEDAKTELKKRWGTMQKLLSSKSRISQIVNDILFDFGTKDRLQSGRGNAILVAGSIYEACKYYELFQAEGLTKCAIITSYDASLQSIKGESTGEDEYTEKIQQYEIYQKMLNGKTPQQFEKDVKHDFIKSPAQMKLLIVVDKLLTGFDAPAATYLYIDKTMRDHGLFQAVCRVNRLDSEDKEYGYIIDYKDLFKSLEKSVNDYTSEAFADYDVNDIVGLLKDRLEKGRENLENAREIIKILCELVEPPQDTPAYIRYFCGDTTNAEDLKSNEPKRITLYKSVAALIRAYANLANDMEEAGYTLAEIAIIKQEVKHYEQVRAEVKLASGDYIDLKTYEPAMRHLIDSYIGAEESEIISNFDDMTLIQLIVERGTNAVDALPRSIKKNPKAVAETIENNLRKLIIEQQPTNPKYFDKMSILLDELIQARNAAADDYKAYLQQIVELSKQVVQPSNSSQYPQSLDTPAKRALYENLNQNEVLALAIDDIIRKTKKDGWRGNRTKEKEVKIAIKKHLDSSADLERIFEIVKSQSEY